MKCIKNNKLIVASVSVLIVFILSVGLLIATKNVAKASEVSRYSSKVSIWNCNVVMQKETFDWTGSPIMPEIIITYNGETLVENVDYELAYYDNIDAGNAYVKIYGINRFKSSRNSDFTIKGKELKGNCKVKKELCECIKSYSCEDTYDYSKYCSYPGSDDICGNLKVYYNTITALTRFIARAQ